MVYGGSILYLYISSAYIILFYVWIGILICFKKFFTGLHEDDFTENIMISAHCIRASVF